MWIRSCHPYLSIFFLTIPPPNLCQTPQWTPLSWMKLRYNSNATSPTHFATCTRILCIMKIYSVFDFLSSVIFRPVRICISEYISQFGFSFLFKTSFKFIVLFKYLIILFASFQFSVDGRHTFLLALIRWMRINVVNKHSYWYWRYWNLNILIITLSYNLVAPLFIITQGF